MRKPLIAMGALSVALLAGGVALPAGAAASDIAIPSVGPFPPVSGYGTTLLGDITLGWHGPPPGWKVQSATHKHRPNHAARTTHRSGWG